MCHALFIQRRSAVVAARLVKRSSESKFQVTQVCGGTHTYTVIGFKLPLGYNDAFFKRTRGKLIVARGSM